MNLRSRKAEAKKLGAFGRRRRERRNLKKKKKEKGKRQKET